MVANELLPPTHPRSEPKITYFMIVKDTNSIFYLLQKYFAASIIPAVRYTPQQQEQQQQQGREREREGERRGRGNDENNKNKRRKFPIEEIRGSFFFFCFGPL